MAPGVYAQQERMEDRHAKLNTHVTFRTTLLDFLSATTSTLSERPAQKARPLLEMRIRSSRIERAVSGVWDGVFKVKHYRVFVGVWKRSVEMLDWRIIVIGRC